MNILWNHLNSCKQMLSTLCRFILYIFECIIYFLFYPIQVLFRQWSMNEKKTLTKDLKLAARYNQQTQRRFEFIQVVFFLAKRQKPSIIWTNFGIKWRLFSLWKIFVPKIDCLFRHVSKVNYDMVIKSNEIAEARTYILRIYGWNSTHRLYVMWSVCTVYMTLYEPH